MELEFDCGVEGSFSLLVTLKFLSNMISSSLSSSPKRVIAGHANPNSESVRLMNRFSHFILKRKIELSDFGRCLISSLGPGSAAKKSQRAKPAERKSGNGEGWPPLPSLQSTALSTIVFLFFCFFLFYFVFSFFHHWGAWSQAFEISNKTVSRCNSISTEPLPRRSLITVVIFLAPAIS